MISGLSFFFGYNVPNSTILLTPWNNFPYWNSTTSDDPTKAKNLFLSRFPKVSNCKHPNGKLYQGNSIDWLASLDDASVNLVLADPPYNIKKAELLADLASVAGDRYNYGLDNRPVNIFVDEAAEVINDPCIQLLNKGRGAKFRLFIATQTFAE